MKKQRFITLTFSICLVLVLAAISLMAACTQPAPAPTPTPTPTPTPAPTQVIKLKLSNHEPPVTVNNKVYKEWAEKIKEQTKGRVEIEIYAAESLAKARDMYSSTVGGVCDIACILVSFARDQFPLSSIMLQPMGTPSFANSVNMFTDLYNKFPEIKAEFGKVELLWVWGPGSTALHFTKKEVHVPADMRGMKVLTERGPELFVAAGATPVTTTLPESYMSLERGLGEGVLCPFDALRVFGLTDIIKYHLDGMGFGTPVCFVIMNKDKWNSLPPDVQKIIKDLSPWATEAVCKAKNAEYIDVRDKSKGVVYQVTPQDRQLWLDVCMVAVDKWVQDQEAKGIPAKKVFEEAKQLTAKYVK